MTPGKLVGVVPIRNLVIAPPDRTLSEMMIADPVKANVFMDQEEPLDSCRGTSSWRCRSSTKPAIWKALSPSDVIDIINQESTEDMYKMVGLARRSCVHADFTIGQNAPPLDDFESAHRHAGGLGGGPVRRHAARDYRAGDFHARHRRRRRQRCNANRHRDHSCDRAWRVGICFCWKAIVKQVSVNIVSPLPPAA